MRAFWTDKKISVILNWHRDVISSFHKSSRNSRLCINIVKPKCYLNVILICRIYCRSLEDWHKVFFGVMDDRNLGIRKRQPTRHGSYIYISKVRGNIVADVSRTICNVKDILNDAICDRVICFVLNKDNIKRT